MEKIVSCPPGINLLRKVAGKEWSYNVYRFLVLGLTFIAYACYHASRKPPSIVKSVLDPESHHKSFPPVGEHGGKQLLLRSYHGPGWPPFNGTDGTAKLGEIDVAFLSCYSLGMYVSGHLGDRLNLRHFLATGMIGSGAFVVLFGMGYFWDVHTFGFYLAMQMLAGLLQATGWPSVVAVMGNWFGERKRGLIMGVWNAHTSIGNISGSLAAASVLQHGWGWSFTLPGALVALGGILIYLFLPAYPEDVGFGCNEPCKRDEELGQHIERLESTGQNPVGFVKAFFIPGVIPYALCLFFSKLVAYTFLYWLPFYLSHTVIGGEYLSVKSAGNLSTLFDVGGIIGGILAGYISDQLNARATTAATFMYLSIPALYAYNTYGGISRSVNVVLMMITGLFVNGPYALITTAVSADLGTHKSLKGDSRALATVTAIIDGTGSVGAALGPLLTGFLSTKGWSRVFEMLMFGAFVAGGLLFILVREEIAQIIRHRKNTSADHSRQQSAEGLPSTPLLTEAS